MIKTKKYSIVHVIGLSVFLLVMVFSLATPIASVYACGNPGEPKCDGGGANVPDGGGSNTGIKIDAGIKNPLGDTIVDIPSFIAKILEFVYLIGIPIIALAIIYAGFLFVTAQGNESKLGKAKQTLLYTIIGAALVLGSYVIANAIKGTVECVVNESQVCDY